MTELKALKADIKRLKKLLQEAREYVWDVPFRDEIDAVLHPPAPTKRRSKP